MLFRIGLMNQVRLGFLRIVPFADVLGLIDEILDFDGTSRDENVAPLQPIVLSHLSTCAVHAI